MQQEAIDLGPYEKDAEELLSPLLTELSEFKELIEVIKLQQEIHKISNQALTESIVSAPPHSLPTEISLIEAFTIDACTDLTKTLTNATFLASNVTKWGFNISMTLGSTLDHLLHCGSINPFSSVSCIVSDISNLKEKLDASKLIIWQFKNDIVSVFQELKQHFKACVGLQINSQAEATQMIAQATHCDCRHN
ncbi:uncharacterized protein isoform X2 [Rhodnius prolixus]